MTKDTEEFSPFTDAAACREQCILPREEEASEPKCWILGKTKLVPVLEVTTFVAYKVNTGCFVG